MPDSRGTGQIAVEPVPAGAAPTRFVAGATAADADKDRPLWDDTRLLGRVLGDTVREQHGARIFDIIERIRQTSIRFRRDRDEDARQELATMMDVLSHAEASQIIRAFGFFSHLANIAEDQHIRRSRCSRRCTATGRSSTRCCRTWMVLAKSDIGIGRTMPNWWPTRHCARRSFRGSARSRRQPSRLCLPITGQQTLLESNPLLARSIRNPTLPYLDPLNHMQIELLKRYRAGDTAEDVVAGIHLTINGIAAGLRNSG